MFRNGVWDYVKKKELQPNDYIFPGRETNKTGYPKYVTHPRILDYEQDVLPLTPAGNATERHICLAYACKARGCFCNDDELESVKR